MNLIKSVNRSNINYPTPLEVISFTYSPLIKFAQKRGLPKLTALIKKTLQFSNALFKASNYLHNGLLPQRLIHDRIKDCVGILDFYATYRNILFWINPFTQENFDKEAFRSSLQSTFSFQNQEKIQEIFSEVTDQKTYRRKREVTDALVSSLRKHLPHVDESLAQKIAIRKKERPFIVLCFSAGFTLVDLGANFISLKKWGIVALRIVRLASQSKVFVFVYRPIVDLAFQGLKIGSQTKVFIVVIRPILNQASLALEIGSRSKVYAVVSRIGLDRVLGIICSAALLLALSYCTYRAVKKGLQYYQNYNLEESQKLRQELKSLLIQMLATGVDFVAATAPLVLALNPPLLIALALVSKGLGIIVIFVVK